MIGQGKRQFKPEIRTLGIDPSLRGTGVCFLTGDVLTPHFLPENKLRGAKRLVELRRRLDDHLVLVRPKPQIAVIEGYSYDSINRLADLAEWGGQVKVELFGHGVPYIVVTPTQLKQFATGNGSADKDKVMEWVEKKWGLCVDGNDNLADAAVLAKIGEVYLTGKSKYRSELEVVKVLKTPKEKKHGRTFRKQRGVL
jgi:crossover junction endodeoxyribonuclease RuvC